MRPTTYIHLVVTGRDENADDERPLLKVIPRLAKVVDGIVVQVLSRFESPDAARTGLAHEIVLAGQRERMKVIWMRNLFVSWRGWIDSRYERERPLWDWATSLSRLVDSDYYADRIRGIKWEVAHFPGLVDAAFYCEPPANKENTLYTGWKARPLDHDRRYAIARAIRDAVRAAGRVSFVKPYGSARDDWYAWPMKFLGDTHLNVGTYFPRHGGVYDKANPPPGYGSSNAGACLFAGHSGHTHIERDDGTWKGLIPPEQVVAFQRKGFDGWYLRKYPDAEVILIYTGGNQHVVPVATALAEARDG